MRATDLILQNDPTINYKLPIDYLVLSMILVELNSVEKVDWVNKVLQ
jgi:hypothetical protein